MERIKHAIIEFLRSKPDAPYLANSKGSWTSHQFATEIENGTEVGHGAIEGMIILTADRILRGMMIGGLNHQMRLRNFLNNRLRYEKL